jgi:hypothetical protein
MGLKGRRKLRIRLVHWNALEAVERARKIEAAGYEVACDMPDSKMLRDLGRRPPAAVVIDLSRIPSQGRDLAVALRHAKTTRAVPLVFVDGDPDKVSRIRELIPDAVYTTWRGIRSALGRAITERPRDPVTFASAFGAYAGTPLSRKLGIGPNASVALGNAPPGFETNLDPLPPGATLHRHGGGQPSLTVWFTAQQEDLENRIDQLADVASGGGLWIVWPKKGSRLATDLTQTVVRRIGLAAGLVDFKVARIDETWTGLRFTRR